MLLRNWHSRLSLHIKVSGASLAITASSLAFVAAAGVMQMHRELSLEQHRSVDFVALGFAQAAESAVETADLRVLTRLGQSFLRDENVLFVAAYGQGPAPLELAVRDRAAWESFAKGNSTIRNASSEFEKSSNRPRLTSSARTHGLDLLLASPRRPPHRSGRNRNSVASSSAYQRDRC